MNIDLGRKSDYCEPCPVPSTSKEPRVIYPSLYIEGGPELKDIPSEGVIRIRYKAVRSSCTSRDDKTTYQLDLEAHEILGADDAPKKSRDQELDELAKRVASDEDDTDDE